MNLFCSAIPELQPNTSPMPPIVPSEIKKSCLQILLSVLCIPNQFASLEIPQIIPPCWIQTASSSSGTGMMPAQSLMDVSSATSKYSAKGQPSGTISGSASMFPISGFASSDSRTEKFDARDARSEKFDRPEKSDSRTEKWVVVSSGGIPAQMSSMRLPHMPSQHAGPYTAPSTPSFGVTSSIGAGTASSNTSLGAFPLPPPVAPVSPVASFKDLLPRMKQLLFIALNKTPVSKEPLVQELRESGAKQKESSTVKETRDREVAANIANIHSALCTSFLNHTVYFRWQRLMLNSKIAKFKFTIHDT